MHCIQLAPPAAMAMAMLPLGHRSPVADPGEVEVLGPLVLQHFHPIATQTRSAKAKAPQSITTCCFTREGGREGSSMLHTLTCALGNCDVRRVSCVSSRGRRLGMLRIRADWSMVAAIAVIRYPLSHRRWTPSLGYRKSSSTTCHHSSYNVLQSQTLRPPTRQATPTRGTMICYKKTFASSGVRKEISSEKKPYTTHVLLHLFI